MHGQGTTVGRMREGIKEEKEMRKEAGEEELEKKRRNRKEVKRKGEEETPWDN